LADQSKSLKEETVKFKCPRCGYPSEVVLTTNGFGLKKSGPMLSYCIVAKERIKQKGEGAASLSNEELDCPHLEKEGERLAKGRRS
jgi:hypothetical protein